MIALVFPELEITAAEFDRLPIQRVDVTVETDGIHVTMFADPSTLPDGYRWRTNADGQWLIGVAGKRGGVTGGWFIPRIVTQRSIFLQ